MPLQGTLCFVSTKSILEFFLNIMLTVKVLTFLNKFLMRGVYITHSKMLRNRLTCLSVIPSVGLN